MRSSSWPAAGSATRAPFRGHASLELLISNPLQEADPDVNPENMETPPGIGEASSTATRVRRINLPQVVSRGGGPPSASARSVT